MFQVLVYSVKISWCQTTKSLKCISFIPFSVRLKLRTVRMSVMKSGWWIRCIQQRLSISRSLPGLSLLVAAAVPPSERCTLSLRGHSLALAWCVCVVFWLDTQMAVFLSGCSALFAELPLSWLTLTYELHVHPCSSYTSFRCPNYCIHLWIGRFESILPGRFVYIS